MIRYSVQIDAADYLAARRLSLRPPRFWRWALWLAAPFALALLAFAIHHRLSSGRPNAFLPMLLGAGIFLLLWYYVLLPLQVRRAYQGIGDANPAPIEGELSDTGVTVTTGQMTGTLAWSDVTGWKRNARLILLLAANGGYTMIPLRGFVHDRDRAAALELLERQLGRPV